MTTIITKNSSTAGAAPTAGDLVQGELAVNVTDKALYTENASGTVVKLNTPSIVDNGNATAITIDSSENVGVGVTPSAWSGVKAIQLNSNLGVYGAGTAEFGAVSNTYYNGTNWIYGASAVAARYAISAGQHQWFNAASGTAGNAISFTQAMTLDAGWGALLVGTTTAPSSNNIRLSIAGRSGGNNGGLQLLTDGGGGGALFSNGGAGLQFYSFTGAAGSESYTERARIDSSGNLLVGSTSSTGAFSVNTYARGWYLSTNHATGINGDSYSDFLYAGTKIGSISQNGTTGVLYNLTSDYRLKNNPVALTGSGAFIDALQPKTWDWWDGSGKGVGFIAHEFMEVAKYSGHGEKDAVDADGKPVYQSIQPSSSEVMANLVAEIQSLRARVAALESN